MISHDHMGRLHMTCPKPLSAILLLLVPANQCLGDLARETFQRVGWIVFANGGFNSALRWLQATYGGFNPIKSWVGTLIPNIFQITEILVEGWWLPSPFQGAFTPNRFMISQKKVTTTASLVSIFEDSNRFTCQVPLRCVSPRLT